MLTPDPIAFNINQLAHNWCFSAVCWLLFPIAHTFRISSPQRCSQLLRTVCDMKVGSQQRFTISHCCLSAWEHSDILQAASAFRHHYVPSLQLLLSFFGCTYAMGKDGAVFLIPSIQTNIPSFALKEKQQHPEAHRAIFSCSVALTPVQLWNSNELEMSIEMQISILSFFFKDTTEGSFIRWGCTQTLWAQLHRVHPVRASIHPSMRCMCRSKIRSAGHVHHECRQQDTLSLFWPERIPSIFQLTFMSKTAMNQ